MTLECPQFLEWLNLQLQRKQCPALPDGEAGVMEVVRSTAPFRRKSLECAGRAFLEGYERCMQSFRAADLAKGPSIANSEVPARSSSISVHSRSCPRRTKPYLLRCQERAERRSKLRPGKELSRRLQGVELYTLLEIEVNDNDFPTMEEVKEAYKRLALIHHPDKKASKSRAFQLIQEAYEYLSDSENKQMYDSTLPFDDSIPSRSELRTRGFFKSLEKVFQRNARFSEGAEPVPKLGAANLDLEKVYDFYEYWYNFESWRDVSPAYLEKHSLELEDIQDCSRHERRARQKHNEQVRKHFDAQERLRLMRLVDLAWQNDPRLHWVSLKAESVALAADETRKAEETAERKGSCAAEKLAAKLAAEEKKKQDETKRIAKSRRQQLKKLVESLGLLVSGVELEKFCLKAQGDAEELEDLADEVERLASLPPEDVTEELTETDEEEKTKKKTEEVEVPSCTFCNGTGLNCVSKHTCMFCDGSGKQKVEPKDGEVEEEKTVKEKRYRRKTPKQLAQEAIFDAIWASGMRPTETRHSPELRQERLERQEREREERRRYREAKIKETKEVKAAQRIVKHEKKVLEMTDKKGEKKVSMFTIPEVVEIVEDHTVPAEDLRKMEEADEVLSSLEHDTNPETVDKVAKLTEFARMGIQGSTQVILASLVASHELRLLLAELEDRRVEEPDRYADEVLLLLSECVAPFFALGLRPNAASKLPTLLRNRVKRVRFALRDLVIGCNFLAILEGRLR